VAATLIFASSPALCAQDASHKLTAMDEFQLQLPTGPQISPDGKKIAYVCRFADPMTDKRYSNLCVINADGTNHRPLTTGNRSDVSPRWSPDGTRLAYLSDADGKQQLYIRWMDTGQTARITNLEQSPDAIAWSPDGKMFSFSAVVPGKGPHIADLSAPSSGASPKCCILRPGSNSTNRKCSQPRAFMLRLCSSLYRWLYPVSSKG